MTDDVTQPMSKAEQSRQLALKRERNKKFIRWGLTILVIVAIGLFTIRSITNARAPGEYDDFARCISETGGIMYGTEWCPHCQEQKRLFGNSFRYIAYVDCDKNPKSCSENGIEGYPTWLFPNDTGTHMRVSDGKKFDVLTGATPLVQLAEQTGCVLS